MFNIDCNGEYVKNHKTLIIVRYRHLEINSYHGYKDLVMHNWKLVDMWSIISRIFFRTSMEMQSYNAWRSIVVWRFNFGPTSVQEAIGFKSLEVNIKIICCDRKEFNESFLAHLAFSSVVRRPSVNISHFNLLLRNHWSNCEQTLVEWSLDGPLSKLCPVIPTSNQDGHQAKNRKKGGWNFNCPLLH